MSGAVPVSHLWLRLRRLTDSVIGAMLGAAVYALWAVCANWHAGAVTALGAGAGHWLTSTCLTYFGTRWMRTCFQAGGDRRTSVALAFIGGLGLTYLALLVVHSAIGTPELLLTLAPGVIPNLLFCGSYAQLLGRTEPVMIEPMCLRG